MLTDEQCQEVLDDRDMRCSYEAVRKDICLGIPVSAEDARIVIAVEEYRKRVRRAAPWWKRFFPRRRPTNERCA